MVTRLMPDQMNLGKHYMTSVGAAIHRYDEWKKGELPYKTEGRRVVMGFLIPDWQRPIVWEEDRQIRFLESVWKGLPLGTYTYNQCSIDSPYDGLLIDGQQRLYSIQRYLEDEFPVFGYRYSEITDADKRGLYIARTFASYITETEDEDYLRSYYDLMNFGGIAHTEDQRASKC